MYVAVGIGRPVVQDKLGVFLAQRDKAVIEVDLIPEGQHLFFFYREIAPHGKRCFREIEGFFIVHSRSFLQNTTVL